LKGDIRLKEYIEERVLNLGYFILETKCTVRAAAKKFGVSKSTVHKDITDRLPELTSSLADKVREILDENKAERHIRGGLATKAKYLARR
jgi:putative DeoR family transcriptional regulator (stage III sporulation protein D)